MPVLCGTDTRYKNTYNDFINSIEECPRHKRRQQFICLQKQCEDRLLLCAQCIIDHRSHSFDKIEKFISPQKFEKIKQGQSKKHRHFDDMADLVIRKLDQIRQSVNKNIDLMKQGIEQSTKRFIQLGTKLNDFGKASIDQHMMLKIKKYLEEQWSYTRCEKMKEIFDKVLNAMQDSYDNLAEDMTQFIEQEDWQNIQETEYKDVEEKWFRHLHSHSQKIVDFFKFDADQKANNIKLASERLEAQYLRMAPGCPFVVCDNYISKQKNKWKILIKDCDSKMLFFNASTIYLGVCRPQVVKRMAYSKLNEGGRGTYLIGSNGWSYHHTDPALDRQDIVGFTFGKGDQILMEVDFNGRGKLKFKKLGKIYDNKFQLPLNLDQKAISKPCLKPCVGFADEVGVTVRVLNLL